MKITRKEAKLFKETHNKWLNESSFIAKLFAKSVKDSLLNDKDLQQAVSDADKKMQDLRDTIEKEADGDKERVKKNVPLSVRKYLGFNY